MLVFGKLFALALLVLTVVLGVTQWSIQERMGSGWPLLVVMYTLVISGCVYAVVWNRRKNAEHARRIKMQDREYLREK